MNEALPIPYRYLLTRRDAALGRDCAKMDDMGHLAYRPWVANLLRIKVP